MHPNGYVSTVGVDCVFKRRTNVHPTYFKFAHNLKVTSPARLKSIFPLFTFQRDTWGDNQMQRGKWSPLSQNAVRLVLMFVCDVLCTNPDTKRRLSQPLDEMGMQAPNERVTLFNDHAMAGSLTMTSVALGLPS